MVRAFTDYGRKEESAPKLIESAQTLIDQGRYDEFSDKCGTEIVLQERRSASVLAILSLTTLDEQQSSRLQQNFQGSASGGVWDAHVKASYAKFVAEAQQLSTINVSVIAIGGGGISELSPLITDFGDLDKVTEALRAYAKSFSFETAAPTFYYTGSVDAFGWRGKSPDFSGVHAFIADLYFLLKDVEGTKTRLRQVVSTDLDTPYAKLLGEEGIRKYSDIQDQYINATQKIYEKGRNCIKDARQCKDLGKVTPAPVKWPILPQFHISVASSSTTFGTQTIIPGPFGTFVEYADVTVEGLLRGDTQFIEYVEYMYGTFTRGDPLPISTKLSEQPIQRDTDDFFLEDSKTAINQIINTPQWQYTIRTKGPLRCNQYGQLPYKVIRLCDVMATGHTVYIRLHDIFGRDFNTEVWKDATY